MYNVKYEVYLYFNFIVTLIKKIDWMYIGLQFIDLLKICFPYPHNYRKSDRAKKY